MIISLKKRNFLGKLRVIWKTIHFNLLSIFSIGTYFKLVLGADRQGCGRRDPLLPSSGDLQSGRSRPGHGSDPVRHRRSASRTQTSQSRAVSKHWRCTSGNCSIWLKNKFEIIKPRSCMVLLIHIMSLLENLVAIQIARNNR